MHIAFTATRIFLLLFQCVARIIVNRGGTRSSKTYSIAQLFVWRLFNIPKRKMGIGRATMPALRQSVMLDVVNIMKAHDLYDPALVDHNKSTNVITCLKTGASITFVSFDEALTQKKRGAGYNDFWFNEANEVTYDNFRQVNMRLTEPVCGDIPNQMFLDLNPDDAETFVKTKLEDKGRCLTIVSTYKDNPFLSPESIAEIEQLEEDDPDYWAVFGKGEWGQRQKGLVYPAPTVIGDAPVDAERIYGLDFGFGHPTALIEIARKGKDIWLREIVYERNLLTPELIEKMRDAGISKHAEIYADGARPEAIQEIYQAGFNIHPADKSAGSVYAGILFCKRFRLHPTADSENVQREFGLYKWKLDKEETPLKEPVKFKDDAMDAIRYGIFTHGSKYWTRDADTAPSPPAVPASARSKERATSGRGRSSNVRGRY